jgi:hypothetical protein
MSLQIASPFQQFFDRDGSPLDNGFVYIGTVNQNPETNPLTVYFDDALTIPAAQPLRTLNGYIVRNGSPARVYTSQEDFSLTVRDKNSVQVFTVADATSVYDLRTEIALPTGANLVGYGVGTVADALDDLIVRTDDFIGTEPILIAIAGQSNAEGINNGGPNPSNSLVKTWDAVTGAWVSGGQYTALPWTRSTPDGNSGNNNFSLGAAHYFAEKTGREVYIVFDAVGGQSITEWVGSGTSSTRYAALKTKVQNALNTTPFTSISKNTIDALIWAQGEEDFTQTFAWYLNNITTLDAQFKAETWVEEWTPFFIMGMSPLHDRYQVSAALRHFSNKSNGQWRYLSTRALRTEFQETGSGDFTHWLGDSLWAGGYDNIGPAILNNERFSNEDNDGLFWNRGDGNAAASDSIVIASFDTLINWKSRSGGVSLTDTFSGNGSTTAFTLVYRGTTISSVTVDGVAQTSPADYSVSGQTITFVVAPPAGTNNVVVTYGASITGVAATGSLAWGYACYPDGNYTFAGGFNVWTDNLANYTILYGRELSTDSNGDYGAGFGFQNALNAPYSLVSGRGNTVVDSGGTAIGEFSSYVGATSEGVAFQVGVGNSDASRKNGLTVFKTGAVEINGDHANNPLAKKGIRMRWINNTTLRITMRGTDDVQRSINLTVA